MWVKHGDRFLSSLPTRYQLEPHHHMHRTSSLDPVSKPTHPLLGCVVSISEQQFSKLPLTNHSIFIRIFPFKLQTQNLLLQLTLELQETFNGQFPVQIWAWKLGLLLPFLSITMLSHQRRTLTGKSWLSWSCLFRDHGVLSQLTLFVVWCFVLVRILQRLHPRHHSNQTFWRLSQIGVCKRRICTFQVLYLARLVRSI